jgi:uncharacterized coiled-coil protein SlyX
MSGKSDAIKLTKLYELAMAQLDRITALKAELQAERKRAEKAEANYRFMVERVADEKLDGYRELGQMVADREAEIDRLKAECHELVSELEYLLTSLLCPDEKRARTCIAKHRKEEK